MNDETPSILYVNSASRASFDMSSLLLSLRKTQARREISDQGKILRERGRSARGQGEGDIEA